MRIDDNAEALAMMNRALGSLEGKIREAYNKGYRDGVKSMMSDDTAYTEWLENKCVHILSEWVCDEMSEYADEWECCSKQCESVQKECLRRLFDAERKDEPQTEREGE